MIPKYLLGMNAAEIMAAQRKKFFTESEEDNGDTIHYDYAKHLERMLLLAVGDALVNAEETKELIEEGKYQAQQRAVIFLNKVLPQEDERHV